MGAAEAESLSSTSSFADLSRILLGRAQRGDGSVWDRIHERYAKRLLLRARAKLGEKLRDASASDAEDLVQETLLVFFSKLDRYSVPQTGQGAGCIHGPLLVEMDRIVKNWNRKGGAAGKAVREKKTPLEPGVAAASGGSPSTTFARQEAIERLSTALTDPRVSSLYRQVIVEVCLEEGDPKQLAAKYEVSYEAYRKRVKRAKDVWREVAGLDPDVELG